jgi:hypothetical protein
MIHDLNREFQDLSGEVQALTAARDTASDHAAGLPALAQRQELLQARLHRLFQRLALYEERFFATRSQDQVARDLALNLAARIREEYFREAALLLRALRRDMAAVQLLLARESLRSGALQEARKRLEQAARNGADAEELQRLQAAIQARDED